MHLSANDLKRQGSKRVCSLVVVEREHFKVQNVLYISLHKDHLKDGRFA